MGVKINGKEVTKEEFRELMLKRVAQQKEVKKLSKTEFAKDKAIREAKCVANAKTKEGESEE